jgi:hypothetical protein
MACRLKNFFNIIPISPYPVSTMPFPTITIIAKPSTERLQNTRHLTQGAAPTHAGILLAHQLSLRELILRFRAFLLRDPFLDYTNQILWLPPVLQEK